MKTLTETRKTLVIGASTNPSRYAHIAINRLLQNGQPVLAYGLREGEVSGVPIWTDQSLIKAEEVDTITLYVGARRQPPLYDWILSLSPRRVIFNPGTENPEFAQTLKEAGITPVEACTLVMLGLGQY